VIEEGFGDDVKAAPTVQKKQLATPRAKETFG
jgi:hypothetical protein